MIACHDALSYRIGSVKEIPTWLDTFHLVALSGPRISHLRRKIQNKRRALTKFFARELWMAEQS